MDQFQQLIPEYLRNLKVYQAGKPIDEVAREKGLSKISKLASNENPLGPSPNAIREMTNALWEIHRYPDMYAYRLINSLADLYNLQRENIILGNGSEGIMAYIARTFIQPGDEVLTSENTFIGFYILARGAGAKLVTTPLKEGHKYDVEKLAKAINDKTKIIYIANPNNPTGSYITKKEFDFLMDHVPERTLVILDEAYFEYAQGMGDYPDSMDYRYDNVVTLRTFSKAYGISGIRCGYGFGHPELINALYKAKLPFEPNSIAQAGGYGALTDRNHLDLTLKNNKKRKLELEKYLKEKDFKPLPSITNFLTFKTGSEDASDFLFNKLLDKGVIIRPLKVNEMPDYVRISVGTKKEMEHFYQAMEEVLFLFDKKYKRPK